MKKFLLFTALMILAFSSCYEDNKPVLRINFSSSSADSRAISFPDLITVEYLHIAVYNPTNMDVPVAKASVSKGTSTVTLTVPKGPAQVVVWLADASQLAQYCSVSQPIVVDDGTNDVTMGPFYYLADLFQLQAPMVLEPALVSWSSIPGALTYKLQKNSSDFIYTGSSTSYQDEEYDELNDMYRVKVSSSVFGISSEYHSSVP